eukprot:jgi/Pico_ML_1/51205/g2282.t2
MVEVLRADSEECFRRLAAHEASRPGKERLARNRQQQQEEEERKIGQQTVLNEKVKQLQASKSQVWLRDGDKGAMHQAFESESSNAKTLQELETMSSLRCSWNEMIDRKNAAKEQDRVEKLLLRKAAEQHARALSEEKRQDFVKKRTQQRLMKEAYDAQIAEK